MEVDLWDIMQDHYTAQLLGPHEVLVQVPAYSYTWLHDDQEYNQDQKCPITKQCHTVNQNAVKNSKDSVAIFSTCSFSRNLWLMSSLIQVEEMFQKELLNQNFISGLLPSRLLVPHSRVWLVAFPGALV